MSETLRWTARATALSLVLAMLAAPVLAADPPAADAAAATPAAANGDPVVAKVSGKPILRSEVVKALQRLGPQAAQMPLQVAFPKVLDQMIATRVASAAGYAKGVEESAEVKDQMKMVRDEVVAQAYVKQTVEPQITDDKIKARYDELVKDFKPEDEVRARHILVQTEAEAKDLIKQIKGGADFAKLAMEKSKDTGSAKQGGDLGYFPKREMVKEFAEAAFAMKPGTVADKPVKTGFGWHVIKVEDKRKSSAPPLDAVRQQVKMQMMNEMAQTLLQDLAKQAKVERFNMDGSPLPPPDATAKKDAAPPAP